MPTKQENHLFNPRIFAGLILLVWFLNCVPSLMAMTDSIDYCQMDCCKGKARHLGNTCSGNTCSFGISSFGISKDASHNVHEGMEDMGQDTQTPVSTNHQKDNHQNLATVSGFSQVPIYGRENILSSDEPGQPFLQIKKPELCNQTAFVSSNRSNNSQRKHQDSDNFLLLSLADKPRLPAVCYINVRFQVVFNFLHFNSLHQISARGPPVFYS